MHGIVRTVVWEDGGRNPASYPIPRKVHIGLQMLFSLKTLSPKSPKGLWRWNLPVRSG